MARLTAGQRACLELVDDHATSKEIARQLGISRHTVDARLRQAIQILGVTSRREAAIVWRAASGAQPYQAFAYQSPRIEDLAPPADTPREGFSKADADDVADVGHEGADGRQAPAGGGIRLPLEPFGAAAGAAAAGSAGAQPFVGPRLLLRVDPGAGPRPEAGAAASHGVADAASAAAWGWNVGDAAPASSGPAFRLWGGTNDLTPAQRVVGILIVTILAMLAFGLLLSGIAALTQLRA